jgi:hypothetical protein
MLKSTVFVAIKGDMFVRGQAFGSGLVVSKTKVGLAESLGVNVKTIERGFKEKGDKEFFSIPGKIEVGGEYWMVGKVEVVRSRIKGNGGNFSKN